MNLLLSGCQDDHVFLFLLRGHCPTGPLPHSGLVSTPPTTPREDAVRVIAGSIRLAEPMWGRKASGAVTFYKDVVSSCLWCSPFFLRHDGEQCQRQQAQQTTPQAVGKDSSARRLGPLTQPGLQLLNKATDPQGDYREETKGSGATGW